MIDSMQPTDGGMNDESEAASEIRAIESGVATRLLQSCLPQMSDEERAERERWKSAKGRGRPRMLHDERHPSMPIEKYHAELGHFVGTQAKTGRGRQEAQYAGWAMSALFEHRHEHPEVLELTGTQTLYATGPWPAEDVPGNILAKKNIGVLAELGRLICRYDNGEEAAVAWTVELVRMKPRLTSKQAVAWLRQRRLQKTNLGNSEGVMNALTTALDAYLAAHPGTSNRAISDAVNGLGWIYNPDNDE